MWLIVWLVTALTDQCVVYLTPLQDMEVRCAD
jgi:hypothetical protein